MEWPPWLKIENIIGKLNISGRFKFGDKNRTSITNNYNIQITLPIISDTETVKTIEADEIPFQKIEVVKETSFELSDDEKIVVEKVNEIHKLNGSDYDFENSYKLALQHIKSKSSSDWFVTAAAHMANSIQGGGVEIGIEVFFNSFQPGTEPQKSNEFINLKEKIKYCYQRLQNLRHVDKSGELKEHMISKYKRIICKQEEISIEDYQQIFTDFQEMLLKLFLNYRIKT